VFEFQLYCAVFCLKLSSLIFFKYSFILVQKIVMILKVRFRPILMIHGTTLTFLERYFSLSESSYGLIQFGMKVYLNTRGLMFYLVKFRNNFELIFIFEIKTGVLCRFFYLLFKTSSIKSY
jgi:hypothetical protein